MSSSHHRVTAVITAYNAERYISRAIDSALGQTFGPVHVIVVDDGSSDETSEVVRSYGSRVELIRLSQNSGPAVGRTTGLMRCTTEFVAFLDSDDYWLPEFVRETVSFLDAHPDVVAVNTGFVAETWNGHRHHSRALDHDDRQYYGTDGAVCPNFYQFWAKYMGVRTGTVVIRTETAFKTEGQRADLRLTEDLEFWAYLATFGRWGFVPKPLFVTDQRVISPRERLAKIKRRFQCFRTMEVEDWARRVRPRLADSEDIDGFERVLHGIATTIILANAYTFRLKKSYRLARQYRNHLGAGLGSALRLGVKGGPLFWPAVCLTLRIKQIVRAHIRFPLSSRCGRTEHPQVDQDYGACGPVEDQSR